MSTVEVILAYENLREKFQKIYGASGDLAVEFDLLAKAITNLGAVEKQDVPTETFQVLPDMTTEPSGTAEIQVEHAPGVQ